MAEKAEEDAPTEDDDEEPSIELFPSCTSDDHGAEVQVTNNLWGFDGVAFEWVLRRDGAVVQREVFTWSEDDDTGTGPRGLTDLQLGSFAITITRVDTSLVVATAEFEVLECVTAQDGCRTLTFFNPPANPALQVTYGPGEDDASDDEEVDDRRTFTLLPGQTRAVTTLRRSAGWEASRVAAPGREPSFAGEDYQVSVSQHCGPTMTRLVVGCARNGAARLDVLLAPPSSRGLRYKIYDFHELVASGRVGADRKVRLSLKASYYNLRFYTADAVLPYDRIDTDVRDCLKVTSTCTGVRFTNPDDWGDTRVTYRVDGGPEKTVTLKEGRRRELRLPPGASVSWQTDADFDDPVKKLKVRVDRGRVVVPAGACQRRLAATGGSLEALPVAVLMLVAGSGLWLARRRTRG